VSDADKPVKTIVQKPSVSAFILSSFTTTASPSSLVGAAKTLTGLMACDYAEARASVHSEFQFLDRMKNVVDDREGKRRACLSFHGHLVC
jgi:hypothetical protein